MAIVDMIGGTHAIIASSAGDGGYVPPNVFLPSTSRLAIHDPSLPRDWHAGRFLGWQHPCDTIEGWFTEIRDQVYRLDVKATATNDSQAARRPRVGGSWAAVHTLQILRRPCPIDPADGAHQHRLAATDAGCWSRLQAMMAASGTPEQLHRHLAVAVTDAVMTAAAQTNSSLPPLALPSDEKLWTAIKSGTATDETWRTWLDESNTVRELAPETYQPLDLDDSAVSRNARLFYGHHFRSARIAELLHCWHPAIHADVADAIYCGLTAGFPDEIARAIEDVNRRSTKP
ncbi:MAG: hypothetical protein JOZ49_15870 [Mycolicibacterium sp.]|nr:hypothetical protein [Mycolicibacterium sp.]